MSNKLTAKQRAIYDFVADCIHAQGIPPSLTEIADAFNLVSASGVADHLRAIERKGYIRRRPGTSRGIELVDVSRRQTRPDATVRVPVVGSLPARGRLSMRRERKRYLFFDGRVAGSRAFAVRVNLSGLEDRGILRGDYLIVTRGSAPAAGELALAQIHRRTVLVEGLAGGRRVRRVDADQEMRNGYEILGKVVAVLRSMNYETTGENRR